MTASRIALLSPAVGTGNVGDYFIEAAIRRLLRDDITYERFSIRKTLGSADIEAINGCRCALICGTNLYQRDWHSALTPAILERIKVPVIPFGVGSSAASLEEQQVSQATQAMIRALHDHCKLGGVRDPHSAEVVRRCGIQNSLLTACPVLFWAQGRELPEIKAVPRKRIVITARNWLMHRWPDNVDHPVQIEFLRRIVDHFKGRDLLFAVHEPYDESLIASLGLEAGSVLRSERPEDYIALYSDPRNVVLAMRLHAGMLSLANGVPALFVAHDTRSYSFCQMMGLEYIELFSPEAAKRTIERLDVILAGEVREFAGLNARFRPFRAAMDRFLEVNDLPAR